MLRSTNANSTSPLLKENERAAASFRDVLASSASTSAQPAKSPATATPGFASQTNSEATDRNEQPLATAIPKDQPSRQNQNQQPAAQSMNQKPAAPQALPLQSPTRSTTSPANISASRDERPQMSATALAAKIAATVVLPAAPAASAAAAIAFPGAPPLSEEKSGGDNRDSSEGSSETLGSAVSDRGAMAPRSETRGQDKPQAPASKDTNGAADGDTDAARETQEPSASAPAGVAGFSFSGNQCSDASQFSNLILPGLSLVPDAADANLSIAKDAPGKTSDQGIGKATDAAIAGSAGKSNQANSAPASTDSSTHSVPGNDQATQHAQSDASQPSLAAAKTADGAATQIQVFATQPATHEAPAAHSRTDSPTEAARSGNLPAEAQNADATTTSGINTARLIQSMGETEMRVGMRSAEFGDISIRTAVSEQQMMAQISVDHSDLGKAISAHIPAMQEKLGGELGLRAMVEVSQSGMSFSGERGYSSHQQPKSYLLPAVTESIQASAETDIAALRTTTSEPVNSYRLDIRV